MHPSIFISFPFESISSCLIAAGLILFGLANSSPPSVHRPAGRPPSPPRAAMASGAAPAPDHYMVLRHENIRARDVFRLLFTKRRLTDYEFVDCSSHAEVELGDVHVDWTFALVAIVQRILIAINTPLKWVGLMVEFSLNLWSLNGGLLGLIRRTLTASVTIPVRGSASYRSIIGHVDGRFHPYKDASLMGSLPLTADSRDDLLGDVKLLDLSMLAAKIAYENPEYIKQVVNNHWKMHFVAYFDCWNKFLSDKTTQAFVFCDRREDARLVCVAFRGTEPFNAHDWLTDTDLSYISMGPGMGRVHLGFMKALGIQDETNFAKGLPKYITSSHHQPHGHHHRRSSQLAYYAIRSSLEALLAEHPNARIVVTGHSLGAALACLLPALLAYHRQDAILDRVLAVITHAQPRVGDDAFKSYMESAVAARMRLYRMVYRYDVVPRVPFDRPPFSMFKHFGTCVYYHSWYMGQVVSEVPNPNYFDLDPRQLILMYLNAWGDLVRAFFLGRLQGKEFEEGWVSIIYRVAGLLLPGVASHSPRDYLNGARLAKIPTTHISKMMRYS